MLFPVVLLRGMSLDGITYATIARNMSQGIGDLWSPFYTATLLNPFYEQPPLALWLQSQLFRLCGDHWWVERVYSALTVVPAAVVLVAIWRTLFADSPRWRSYGWLAIGMWVLMPGWFWIYRHNYLENTLGIFTALSVLASLRAARFGRGWPAWTLLAALALVAALGCKGPVGLFPLVTPMLAWLTLGPGPREVGEAPRLTAGLTRALGAQALLLTLVAALVAMCLLDSDARAFLSAYYQRQVLDSLHGQRETVNSVLGHLHLLWALLVHLFPNAAIAGVLALLGGRRGVRGDSAVRRAALFVLLTAMSASLPIMVSPKQSGYYTAPSWPLYSMTLAICCLPAVAWLCERLAERHRVCQLSGRLRLAAGMVCLGLVAASPLWIGSTQRDAHLIADVERIGSYVGDRQIILIPAELDRQWSLRAYLYRWHYISTQVDDGPQPYRLEPAENPLNSADGWVKCDARLHHFRLYQRQGLVRAQAQQVR